MRSVRSLLPNSIDAQLDLKELIRRLILNHAEKVKNKQLEGRFKLYENGITDKSLHASQTNIKLLTIANEDNSSGCNCQSQSLWGVIEVIAVLLACILLLYILYSCLVSYCARRKVIREKRERRPFTKVETRMGRSQMDKLGSQT